jgi:hypothetical protein
MATTPRLNEYTFGCSSAVHRAFVSLGSDAGEEQDVEPQAVAIRATSLLAL